MAIRAELGRGARCVALLNKLRELPAGFSTVNSHILWGVDWFWECTGRDQFPAFRIEVDADRLFVGAACHADYGREGRQIPQMDS